MADKMTFVLFCPDLCHKTAQRLTLHALRVVLQGMPKHKRTPKGHGAPEAPTQRELVRGVMRGTIVLDHPAQIEGFRLCTLRAALKLEIKGLRHSRGSVYAAIKKQFGFRGSKERVLEQLSTYIEQFNRDNGFTREGE